MDVRVYVGDPRVRVYSDGIRTRSHFDFSETRYEFTGYGFHYVVTPDGTILNTTQGNYPPPKESIYGLMNLHSYGDPNSKTHTYNVLGLFLRKEDAEALRDLAQAELDRYHKRNPILSDSLSVLYKNRTYRFISDTEMFLIQEFQHV